MDLRHQSHESEESFTAIEYALEALYRTKEWFDQIWHNEEGDPERVRKIEAFLSRFYSARKIDKNNRSECLTALMAECNMRWYFDYSCNAPHTVNDIPLLELTIANGNNPLWDILPLEMAWNQ
jgi:hypothetical protein